MKENFIPFEEAKELKELGFDEPCFAYYEISSLLKEGYRIRYVEHENSNPLKQSIIGGYCLAPLFQQAFSFFREEYDLIGIVQTNGCGDFDYYITGGSDFEENTSYWTSYEEAQLECLKMLIKLSKEK